MLHAIDAMRAAPAQDLAGRRALLEAVRADPARAADALAARDACVRAYDALLDGLERKERVRARMDAPDPALLSDLAAAQKSIAAADEAMPGCNAAVASLRRAAR